MYFGSARFWDGGHETPGVTTPATEWFLAEGATGPYFDTYVLVGNPNDAPVDVTLTFLLPDGRTHVSTRTIGARARLTVAVEEEAPVLANTGVSTWVTASAPVIVERAMYWPGNASTWTEAHDSFGVTAAATRWGIADGRAGGALAFETFILLANTGVTAADVRVTFLRQSDDPLVRTYTVGAQSRFNIPVGLFVPELAQASFGAIIESTNGVPIVVERSTYWNALGTSWAAGTNTPGVRVP